MRLIVGRALAVSGVGIVAGLLIAMLTTRGLESLLYGVSRFDPATFAAVAIVLAGAAALAAYLPARRAVRIDPLVALRR
jgi:putative ABC transport system permease protein